MKLKRRIAYQTQISYIFRSFLLRNCRESCKRAQLSYSNLLSAEKRVSTKIVNEICQPDVERNTSKPNGTYRQPIHECCHKPKNMFNPTTNFGFSAVVFFPFFGQGGVAITFFTNFISDVFGEFLSCISTVGITYFIYNKTEKSSSYIPTASEWYCRLRDSDMKAFSFSDILFAPLTCKANITRRKPNITAKQ